MAIDTNKLQQQASDLSSQLWAIANDLRGGMDANEFRNYILGTIFYRYLSERTEMYMEDILKEDGLTYEQAFTDEDFKPIVEQWSLEHLGYIIRPENLFRELNRRIVKPNGDADKFSVEDYERAVNELTGSTLGHKSEKAFEGLFNDMRLQDTRLGDTVSERTDKIGKVIAKIGEIDMNLQDQQFDVLGTAYMILIGLFQSGAGKKGGEFFTPTGPSKLCATLATLGLDEAKTVGDCTCGSGSMLLETQKHLTNQKVGHFYGQEINPTTYNLARMNMLMHGVDYQDFDIFKGDTLTRDLYGEDLRLTVQVCNPPYSFKWSADSKYLDDPRYSGVGKLAPKGHADFAFLQHMVYHMDEADGRIAVLLPHGVLFRGDAEDDIRKYLIKDLNRLDAVIGLPANLFHGTPIPVVLLVLKSNRHENSNNVLFIDASKEFKKGKKQNTLEEEHIKRIVDAYIQRQDIPHFAHVASMDEIKANDYKLNILAYVKLDQIDTKTDALSASETLITAQKNKELADQRLMEYARKLGIYEFTPEAIKKVISGRLRFSKDDGTSYQDWKAVRLGDVLTERREKSGGSLRICSVALKGVVDQIEHLGRSYAASDTSNYGRVEFGDVVYTKSPTGAFPFGIVKQSQMKESVAVSPLYGIFIPKNYYLGKLLHYYFESPANTNNYLAPIIQKGAKNTINISNDTFLSATLYLPMDEEEQKTIVAFISAFDEKIQADISIANAWSEIKGGLLNNMFLSQADSMEE